METFETIWSSSRQNEWTNIYLYVIAAGVSVLIALSFIKHVAIRRTLKILAVLGFAYGTGEASFQAINTKWQIRHEWTEKNWDDLTEDQQMASISDGANLVFGPINEIVFALTCFTITILILIFMRRFLARKIVDRGPKEPQTIPKASRHPNA